MGADRLQRTIQSESGLTLEGILDLATVGRTALLSHKSKSLKSEAELATQRAADARKEADNATNAVETSIAATEVAVAAASATRCNMHFEAAVGLDKLLAADDAAIAAQSLCEQLTNRRSHPVFKGKGADSHVLYDP